MQTVDYYLIKKRLLSLILATVFLFVVIFAKLFYIQIIWGKDLQSRALDQWTRDLPLVALRGDIVDTNGDLIATSRTCFNVYARPQSVQDHEYCAEILSNLLELDFNTVYSKIIKKGVSEVTIAKKVSADVVSVLQSKNLLGIYYSEESERIYVYGDFMSQVLGFVSSDNVGQSGIESYYDKYLQGINGQLLTQTDLIGKELQNSKTYYLPSVKGLQLVLTIDREIQTIVENVLEKAIYQYGAQTAGCIVMDVTNGDILAMSSKPSLNLNELPRDNVAELVAYTKNVLLTDIYEPGSTFKIITASACLEEYQNGNTKAFSDKFVFTNSSRTRIIDGSKISCWSTHANGKHSNQTLCDALCNSCNPIFTDIALSLGKNTFYNYLSKFGFGSKTGIDYAGEQSGIVISQQAVTSADLARIGFGQSVAITPLQLCVAVSSAINGGEVLVPHLVKQIVDPTTQTVVCYNSKTVKNRVISPQTSEKIVAMLEEVAMRGGGKAASVSGYQIGGKTGLFLKKCANFLA